MNPTRRGLFQNLASAGATPALLAMAEQLASAAPQEDQDQDVLDFWSRDVRKAPAKARGGGPRPASFDREPAFLHYSKDKGIQMASSMDEEGLPPTGNMEVEFNLRSHRLSREDQERFDTFNTGTLRVDVGQSQPFQDVGDLLVWSVIGGLAPAGDAKNSAQKAMRDYQASANAAPPSASKVKLPGGSGWSTVNFFLKQKQSVWGSVLGLFLRMDQAFVPMLGLPSMAVQGLAALDGFIGKMHGQGGSSSHSWVFQNNRTDFCSTIAGLKQSADDVVRMKNGVYVLVPSEHLGQFEAERKNLKMVGGFLVPKSVSDFQARNRISDTLPDVSYITIQTRVRPTG